MGYPIMAINEVKSLIKDVDLVWITDVEFLVAPRIKRIRRNVPIIAHLHSYALICPSWSALYGFKNVCTERCSARRIIHCKQGINMELAKIGILSETYANLYNLLDFIKGPTDFIKWKTLMRGILESIDGFIAVSHALWDIHVAHVPELREKPHIVVYNLATLPLKYVKPDINETYEDYILYASGTNPVKGPHLLLNAWKFMEREYPGLKLMMIGCRDSWVERMTQKLGLKNVILLDKIPAQQYYDMMYRARAVVMPSVWPEPFGRIPIEANRLGVPAIVSNRGGLAEIVEPGISGEIWNCCSSDSLAEVISKVLRRIWSREKIIKSVSTRFDLNKIRDSIINYFRIITYD